MRAGILSRWDLIDRTLHHNVDSAERLRSIAWIVIVMGGFYGAVMGSYGWLVADRGFAPSLLQVFYSASKVPLMLFLTFLISLPAFYVLNALLGLSEDFRIGVQNILISQAAMAIALCSLSPLILFWYLSARNTHFSYTSSILLNAVSFAVG